MAELLSERNDEGSPESIRSQTHKQKLQNDAVAMKYSIVSEKNATYNTSSEKTDRQAFRSHARRERPKKLKIIEIKEKYSVGGTQTVQMNAYEPELESFVSGCIPGVSFVTGANKKRDGSNQSTEGSLSQRRTKLIRKRSLPLLSFLSSIHLAHAKKKCKKETQEKQKSIAEEEAKKALLLNPIQPKILGNGSLYGDLKPAPCNESKERDAGLFNNATSMHVSQGTPEEQSDHKPRDVVFTTTIETTSNILMPPLLKDFLSHLERTCF